MNEVSGFWLNSAYFAWKRKIERTLLCPALTHIQFGLLMSLGFLKKEGANVSQNKLAKYFSFDVTMTSQVLRERSKFSKLTEAEINKIQAASKDLLKAEELFFAGFGKSKGGFDEKLRGILRQQTVGISHG